MGVNNMYHNILVPLDGSKRAEAILPHAIDLAQRYGARVILLRIVEPTVIGPEMSGMVESQLVEQGIKDAQDYLSGVQGTFREKGIETEAQVHFGTVVGTILQWIARYYSFGPPTLNEQPRQPGTPP
jgi:nucleotide-binding universal stress UspA family protein